MSRICTTKALSWDDLRSIIGDPERLIELGRSEAQQMQYDTDTARMRTEFATVSDMILTEKFGFQKILNKDGKIAADRGDAQTASSAPPLSSQTVLALNDYPYHYEAGIEHFVLWKHGIDNISCSSSVTEDEIVEAKSVLLGAFANRCGELLHWTSPPHLKSIPEIEHVHIVMRWAGSGSGSVSVSGIDALAASTRDILPRHIHLLIPPTTRGLTKAARRIAQGKLVAFPTETVYGLGAHALNEAAVLSIFTAKGRPLTDPLIVHVCDAAAAAELVQLTAEEESVFSCLARSFWPGPLTIIAKAVAAVPPSVTAHTGFVGVRVPAHPIAQQLLQISGLPIAAPSANRFGHVSPTLSAHVLVDLAEKGDVAVINGEHWQSQAQAQAQTGAGAGAGAGADAEAEYAEFTCRHGIESTVAKVDGATRTVTVFRQGAVTREQLQDCLDKLHGVGGGGTEAEAEAEAGAGAGQRPWSVLVVQRHVKMEAAAAAAAAEQAPHSGSTQTQTQAQTQTQVEVADESGGQQAPGQAITHYAPDVPCYLLSSACVSMSAGTEIDTPLSLSAPVLRLSASELARAVLIDFGGALLRQGIQPSWALAYRDLSPKGSYSGAAMQLFDTLRWAEMQVGALHVLISLPAPPTPAAKSADTGDTGDAGDEMRLGVVDRLTRAASGKVVGLVVPTLDARV